MNFATGRATVDFDPSARGGRRPRRRGGAHRLRPGARRGPRDRRRDDGAAADDEQRAWLRRVLVAWPLSVAVVAVSMVWPHDAWARWTAALLTVPVQFWAGFPFLRAAAVRARAGAANMDTLVAIGTLAAFGLSTVELLRGAGHHLHYFDTAALIIAFLVLGRWVEARAKGRATRAITALLELGAKEASLVDPPTRRESTGCRSSGCGSATSSGSARARRSRSTGLSSTAPPRSTSRCSPASRSPSTRGPATTVAGATVNRQGVLTVRATAVGADTALAQIVAPGGGGPGFEGARCSAWPTGSRGSSCRSSSCWPLLTFAGWAVLAGDPGRGPAGRHRRPDRRLPLCPGPGHADGDHGRHGPGGQPGRAHQGRRGPGAVQGRRHRRVRQDGHADDRRDVADRRGPGGRRGRGPSCWPWPPRPRPAPSTRSGGPSSTPPAGDGLDLAAGHRLRGRHRRRRPGDGATRSQWSSAAGVSSRSRASTVPPELGEEADRLEGLGRTVVFAGWDGQARGVLAVADTAQGRGRRPQWPTCVAMGLDVVMITGDNRPHRRPPSPPGSASTGSWPSVLPAGKVAEVAPPPVRGQGGRHGRRRRERRPRPRRGRPGHRHRHRHRRGHRVVRHHPAVARPRRRGHRPPPVEGDVPHHPAEPGLGLRLQPGRHPARRVRPASTPSSPRPPWACPACRWWPTACASTGSAARGPLRRTGAVSPAGRRGRLAGPGGGAGGGGGRHAGGRRPADEQPAGRRGGHGRVLLLARLTVGAGR